MTGTAGEPLVARTLFDDHGFLESARWHAGRFWMADWKAGQVVAFGQDGSREIVARLKSWPMSIGFLGDGRLLILSNGDHQVFRREHDGTLAVHATLEAHGQWNEMVVDVHDNVYVNNMMFNFHRRDERVPGYIAAVRPDGTVHRAAENVHFPNGMLLTDDGRTLVVSESNAHRLTAFDCRPDATLHSRRVWAELGDTTPDGIIVDSQGAIWVSDPELKQCVRVAEGGTVTHVIDAVDTHSCALGEHTLLMIGKGSAFTAQVAVGSPADRHGR